LALQHSSLIREKYSFAQVQSFRPTWYSREQTYRKISFHFMPWYFTTLSLVITIRTIRLNTQNFLVLLTEWRLVLCHCQNDHPIASSIM
jgi:hypothetical protein